MCVVSMIIDGARKMPWDQWEKQIYPNQVDDSYWKRKYFELLEDIRKAEELDKKYGIPDCVDPEKEKFLKELADRLEKLEKRVAAK